jgi:asparagine synthase (glutamine-hydrolysing)
LIFSSEIKSIDIKKTINKEAKILYLLLGYVSEPWTIYNEIDIFPAGHYGYYKNSNLEIFKYNEYEYEPKLQKPYSEIVKNTKELFENSIKRHLISDAPIGTFLSGGLDSSAITAVAAKYKQNLHTLSLVFNEKDLSEEYYQDLVAKKYNTNHTKFLIDEKLFLDTINDFFDSMEQPTIDGLNTYFGRTVKLVEGKGSESNLQKTVITIGNYLIAFALFLIGISSKEIIFNIQALIRI